MARHIDTSHFPAVTQHSVLLPGPERIRGNVFFPEPITGLPCGKVHTVYDNVRRGMQESGDGPFIGEIVNGAYTWYRYSEVLDAAKRAGSALLTLGRDVKRVGLAGIHSARFTMALHALVDYSITAVPLYHNSKMEDLCHIISSCNLEVIIADSTERAASFVERKSSSSDIPCLKTIILLEGTSDEVPGAMEAGVQIIEWDDLLVTGTVNPAEERPPKPEDVYVICHTSGTTGRPKGVQTTHSNLLAAVAGLYCQWCLPPHKIPFDKTDVYFSFLSLAHIYEHLMQNFMTYIGGRVGIYSGDTAKILPDMQLLQPTIVALVPRLLNKFYDAVHARMAAQSVIVRTLFKLAKWWKLRLLARGVARFDTIWDRVVFSKVHALLGGKIRLLTTGGAPVSPAVKDFTRIAYGALMFEGYGQTECGAAGTLNLPTDTLAGHVGGPAPWSQIKLVDVPDLGYYAKEDRGEVCFRGAAVMSGYLGDRSLTEKTVDSKGWLHTGDIGQWLQNGSLAIVDRKNAFFKLAQGDFVAPEIIEGVYAQSSIVQQIFITGRTTRSFLVAIVVLDVMGLRTSLSNAGERLRPLASAPINDLMEEKKIKEFVLDELTALGKSKGLTSIELPRNIWMTSEEFTAEAGFLTSTLKMRRHILAAHFADKIEEMYSEISSA